MTANVQPARNDVSDQTDRPALPMPMGTADRSQTRMVLAGLVGSVVVCLVALIPPVRDAADDATGILFVVIAIAIVAACWQANRLIAAVAQTATTSSITAGATHLMAQAAADLATASHQQRLDAVRPVIVFAIVPGAQVLTFTIRVANSGVGPALDLHVTVENSPLRHHLRDLPQPLAVASGATVEAVVGLSEEQPFTDPEQPIRWPRDEEEAALIASSEPPPRDDRGRIGLDPAEQLATLQRLQDRYRDFRRDTLIEISRSTTTAGTLTATYRDIYGRSFTSAVPVVLIPDTDEDQPAAIKLGATTITMRDEGRSG